MPKVQITDTILRDGHQSQAATRNAEPTRCCLPATCWTR